MPFNMESLGVEQYHYLIITAVSCICTIATYYLVEVKSKNLSQQIKDGGSHSDRLTLLYFVVGSKARSNFHAVVTFPLAVYSLLYGQDINNFVWWDSDVACLSCSITLGYMIGDLFIDVLYWDEMGEVQYLLHHVITISSYTFVITTRGLQMFAMVRSLCEGSNLFVNSRNVLHHAGLQKTLPYYFNAVAMLISFAFSRILTIPLLLYMLISAWGTQDFNRLNLFGQALPFAAHAVMDTLNLIWFYKIVRSVKRIMTTLGNGHDDRSKNGNTKNRNNEIKQVY